MPAPSGREAGRGRYLERGRWTAQGEQMRRALAGLMQQRSGIILGADVDKCSIYGLFIGIAATMSMPKC